MDKETYIDTLKSLNSSNPKKIKVEHKSSKETILMEQSITKDKRVKLEELFVQSAEIESIPPGTERDVQILRLSMIAELDASNLYEKLATLTKDKRIKEVLLDVSKEEKVHAGEFEALLERIDKEYEEAEEEGKEEVEDMLKNI
jgi:rubrerythrin